MSGDADIVGIAPVVTGRGIGVGTGAGAGARGCGEIEWGELDDSMGVVAEDREVVEILWVIAPNLASSSRFRSVLTVPSGLAVSRD